MPEEESARKCIILITGNNSEKAYGPFYSFGVAQDVLKSIGYERKSDAWWQRGKIDAYIKLLYAAQELGS